MTGNLADPHEPGQPPGCAPGGTGGCVVCRDEGQVGEVVELLDDGATARVRVGGGLQDAALDLLGDVQPGERLIVHLGFAIARIREP